MPKTKRFQDSLIFKIGVVIVAVESIVLFALGFYYINRFSNEIDERIHRQLQIPGILMGKGLLNYESVEDKKTMEQLVGETLIDALLIGINHKVFYSLNRDYVGRKITEIPGIKFIDRLDETLTEIEEMKISEGQKNFRISITPIRLEDGKIVGFLYIKAGTDQLEYKKKILTMVFVAGSLFCILLTTCITVWLLHWIISKRIQNTLAYLKKVEAGYLETRIDPILSQDEIGLLQKGINSMVSEIEERTGALQESEDRYKGLVESCPDAIFVEQDGKIVYVNPAGLDLFGYKSMFELNGYGLWDLFIRQDDNPTEKWISSTPETRPSFMEGKLTRKDGELIDVEVILTHTRYQGRPAVQIMVRDVTEIKNLRQKAQRMKQLADLGQLSATIAHEIRNPLASIRLGLEKLSDRLVIPGAYKTIFSNIEQGISRIQAIIDGILDFTRQVIPDLKKVNLHDLLDSSLSSVQNELEQARIIIIKSYLPIQPYVLVDPLQMIQVFVNLFLNAKQAMPSGGKLTIRTILRIPPANRRASFGSTQDRPPQDIADQAPLIEVQIEDTGKGIPPENLDKIFTPFFTTRANGIGLGLAVVSRILEQHQAQICVESQVGVGTKFIIKLPFPGEDYEKSYS
jgi:PAS domain S-box-containing protein